MEDPKFYPPFEEKINIFSHALGLLLSIVASVLLIRHAIIHGTAVHVLSFGVFGASLIILYSASVAYHRATSPAKRSRLRVVDHAAIYILIAGSYTPFTLITLAGKTGRTLFVVAWAMAIAGVTLKIFFTGRYKLFSTLMYVLMGWLMMFAIKPLANNLATGGLDWLIAGGLAYTIGAVLYGIKSLKMNHAIFHVFVLAGSTCHVVAVLFYILPA